MKSYNSTRAKIRGWKRRVRQVDKWGARINSPDLECIEVRGYTYERCTLYPYDLAQKRQPPVWFHKCIIDTLLIAYGNWMQVLRSMTVYYDLKLWVRYPTISQSEIICYRVSQPGEQRHVRSETSKPTSLNSLMRLNPNLDQFDWVVTPEVDTCDDDDFENAAFAPQNLIADGYIRKEQPDGMVYYAKRFGNIWIGRHKDVMSNGTKDVIQGYFAPPKATE